MTGATAIEDAVGVHSDQVDVVAGTTGAIGVVEVAGWLHSDQEECSEDTGATGVGIGAMGVVDVTDCVHTDQEDCFEVVAGAGGMTELEVDSTKVDAVNVEIVADGEEGVGELEEVHSTQEVVFDVVTGAGGGGGGIGDELDEVHSTQEVVLGVVVGAGGVVDGVTGAGGGRELDEVHSTQEDSFEIVTDGDGEGSVFELNKVHIADDSVFKEELLVVGTGAGIVFEDVDSTQLSDEEVVTGRGGGIEFEVTVDEVTEVTIAAGGGADDDHSVQTCGPVGFVFELLQP